MLDNLKKERRIIFFLILILNLFGLLMVYESSSMYAYKIKKDPLYFLERQFLFFIIGLIMFFFSLAINLEHLKKYNKEFLLFNLFLLFLLLFVGKKIGGAKRWFFLGGFNFQPSELLKLSFLLYCADYFKRKKNFLNNFYKGILPLGLVLSLMCLLLILQPDLGGAIFWITWIFIFLFFQGVRKRYLILLAGAGLFFSFLVIQLYPSRFQRILIYFNPFSDPKGVGFQLVQSQIAFGRGGLFGVGLGESLQKLFFLPAAHTDFIFSIIAEEFGLIGSLGIIFIFFLLFHKMVKLARNAQENFRRNILWGAIFIFFLEIIINMGVSCGLLPTKGLSLPFISYGGSNLITHFVLLGVFFNASCKK
ncbi:MAG TPA: putative lipid II flippase FtsW [Candidatus Omnitrophica bacterium]|nr:putative lipid II flippase FtsW [Candidatus Omnitrophota bacterium]